MDFWMGYEHFFISPYHIGGRNILWFFNLDVLKIRILDMSFMTWKKYGGNQCKLVGKGCFNW